MLALAARRVTRVTRFRKLSLYVYIGKVLGMTSLTSLSRACALVHVDAAPAAVPASPI